MFQTTDGRFFSNPTPGEFYCAALTNNDGTCNRRNSDPEARECRNAHTHVAPARAWVLEKFSA